MLAVAGENISGQNLPMLTDDIIWITASICVALLVLSALWVRSS